MSYYPCTIKQIFTYSLDCISMPKKSVIRMLAKYTTNVDEQNKLYEICSKNGSNIYLNYIKQKMTLLDLLNMFPSCLPLLDHLIDLLPAIQPRSYSASLFDGLNPRNFSFAFTKVSYMGYNHKVINGLCTNWLYNELKHNKLHQLPIFIRTSETFTLPLDTNIPIIMIGTGTGVAPYRAFIQQFIINKSLKLETNFKDLLHLYFGCRLKQHDYIYGNEFEQYYHDEILTTYRVAFSRQNKDKKMYVQHLMKEDYQLIANLILKKNATIYVCGDGTKIANDILDTISYILNKYGLDKKEVLLYIRKMIKNKRLIQEVWS